MVTLLEFISRREQRRRRTWRAGGLRRSGTIERALNPSPPPSGDRLELRTQYSAHANSSSADSLSSSWIARPSLACNSWTWIMPSPSPTARERALPASGRVSGLDIVGREPEGAHQSPDVPGLSRWFLVAASSVTSEEPFQDDSRSVSQSSSSRIARVAHCCVSESHPTDRVQVHRAMNRAASPRWLRGSMAEANIAAPTSGRALKTQSLWASPRHSTWAHTSAEVLGPAWC